MERVVLGDAGGRREKVLEKDQIQLGKSGYPGISRPEFSGEGSLPPSNASFDWLHILALGCGSVSPAEMW
jgi:hypothetical protein